jgi:hypothetical protein
LRDGRGFRAAAAACAEQRERHQPCDHLYRSHLVSPRAVAIFCARLFYEMGGYSTVSDAVTAL